MGHRPVPFSIEINFTAVVKTWEALQKIETCIE